MGKNIGHNAGHSKATGRPPIFFSPFFSFRFCQKTGSGPPNYVLGPKKSDSSLKTPYIEILRTLGPNLGQYTSIFMGGTQVDDFSKGRTQGHFPKIFGRGPRNTKENQGPSPPGPQCGHSQNCVSPRDSH